MGFQDFAGSLPVEFDTGAIERAAQFSNDCETDAAATSRDLPLHAVAEAMNKRIGNLADSHDLQRDQLLFLDSLVCQLWLGDPAVVKRWDNLALVPYMEWRDQGAYPPPVTAHPTSVLPYLRRRAETTTRADLRARYLDFLLLHPSTPRHDRARLARAAHAGYMEAGTGFDVSETTQTAIAFEYLGRALDLSAAYNFERPETASVVLAHMREAIEGGASGFAWQVAIRQARLLLSAGAEANEFVQYAIGAASQPGDHQTERALWEMVESMAAKLKDGETIRRARLAIAASWEAEADEHKAPEEALARVALIHEALRAYGQIGSGQDGSKSIERLKAPYADAVQLAAKQMTTHTTALDLPKLDDMKAAIAQEAKWLDEAPHGWLLLSLRWSIWPDWDDVRARFNKLRTRHPIEWLASRIKVTADGRVIFPPEDEAKREESYLLDYFVRDRLITSGYFRVVLDILHKEGSWTAGTLVAAVADADEVLAAACSSGFQAYEAGDYWTATHVLVPQLERALRDIALRSSASVLKLVTNESLGVATLNPILSDERVVQVLTPKLVASLKALFTDPEGLNIRNEIAHGLVSPREDMGSPAFLTVMAILTAACILGFVKQEAGTQSKD